MTTAANSSSARTTRSEASHYYLKDGTPFYEVPYADPKKGMRRTTLADARKVGALPSVTTLLSILRKPALETWLIEQAVLAVMTTPRRPGEADDAFIQRVLHTEKQQDQQTEAAMDLGTRIHDAIESDLKGGPVPDMLLRYTEPVRLQIEKLGKVIKTEAVTIGQGYAGRIDLELGNESEIWIIDFKTSTKLPQKKSWDEHVIQLSAYAAAERIKFWEDKRPIKTANIYISTKEPGQIAMFENPDYLPVFTDCFIPIMKVWQWMNCYDPTKATL